MLQDISRIEGSMRGKGGVKRVPARKAFTRGRRAQQGGHGEKGCGEARGLHRDAALVLATAGLRVG